MTLLSISNKTVSVMFLAGYLGREPAGKEQKYTLKICAAGFGLCTDVTHPIFDLNLVII